MIATRELYELFTKVNADCATACALGDASYVPVPFTDEEYYTQQIMNIYEKDEAEAAKMAHRLAIYDPNNRDEVPVLYLLDQRVAGHGGLDTTHIVILAMAWLQLHMNEPGMHPDDYLDKTGPYCGINVLLAHEMFKRIGNTPLEPLDDLLYPGFISLFADHTMGLLHGFHVDDEDDYFKNRLVTLEDMLKNMELAMLDSICMYLDELVSFHEGCPEDVFESLSQTAAVFAWIKYKR